MSEINEGTKIKVGALIIVSVALLVGFVLLLGGFQVGEKRHFYLELHDSGSILRGAPVKIAGVRAGRVLEVKFLVERNARKSEPLRKSEAPINVRLKVAVDAEMAHAVRKDSEFFVTTQGVLGEKYLEIIPGSDASPEWEAGAHIRGKDPARLDLLFARMDGLLSQVEQLLKSGDMEIGELVTALTRLTKNLDAFLEKNKGEMDTIVSNVAGATEDARALLGGLRRGVGDGSEVAAILSNTRKVTAQVGRDARPMVATARKAMENADGAITELRGFLAANREPLNAAIGDLPSITADTKEIARDTAWLSERLKSGKGTVGQMLTDVELYDDLKEMLRDLKRHPWKMLWRE